MMLKVITQIYVWDVPPADVVVGLLPLNELIMLGDYMDGCGVWSDRAEASDEGEEQSVSSPKVVDEVISEDDEDIVRDLVSPNAWIMHENWPQCIERFNDDIKEIFVPFVVVGEFRFPRQRQVWVSFKLVQKVMMVSMVSTERDGTGETHRDVAQHRHNFVEGHVAASAVMSEIVDAAMKGVVEESSNKIGIEKYEPYAKILHFLMVTLDQQQLASMNTMMARAIMIVYGLSSTSSLAISGWSLRIIRLRTKCDYQPLTQEQTDLNVFGVQQACSMLTGGDFRVVKQFVQNCISPPLVDVIFASYQQLKLSLIQILATVKAQIQHRTIQPNCKYPLQSSLFYKLIALTKQLLLQYLSLGTIYLFNA